MNTITPRQEQQKIIEYEDSLVVIAKPGSGKTFVVSEKVRRILQKLNAYEGVIAISYTNKASDELKQRSKRDGIDIKSSFFGTIDRFLTSEIIFPFLKQLWGVPENEVVVTKIQHLPEEEKVYFDLLSKHQISYYELIEHLDKLKEYFLHGKLFLETHGALAMYVLENSLSCRKYIKARYSHIIIDEYQDTGLEQHNLFLKLQQMGLIAIAVGDADQSIFGFSGKSSEYLLQLAMMEDFRTFPLETNHRCHESIINYSMRLLDENAELLPVEQKRVYKKTVTGTQINIGYWIENNIEKVKEAFNINRNSNIAILVRSKNSGILVKNAMSIESRYFETTRLEEHYGVWAKLFTSLLYYRYNDLLSAEDIVNEVMKYSSQVFSIRDLRSRIKKLKTCNEVSILNNFHNFASYYLPVYEDAYSVELLRSTLEIGEELMQFKPVNDNEIQIMTLHKSKGLEFDVVFHLDLYEWVFPTKFPGDGGDFENPIYPSWEQDINLHYVGITRAKKACILCTSSKRIKDTSVRNGKDSEFFHLHNLYMLRKDN